MKKIFQKIIEKKYILLILLLIILRILFSIKFPVFYIKNKTIDDGLMINHMMSLSQRIVFRHILSKNSY